MRKILLLFLYSLPCALWAQISLDATSITNWYGKTRTYKVYNMDANTQLQSSEQVKMSAHIANVGTNKTFDFSNLATPAITTRSERYEATIDPTLPGAAKGIAKGATQSYFSETTDLEGKKTRTYLYQNITASQAKSWYAYAFDPNNAVSETDYVAGLTQAVFPTTMGLSFSSETDILSTTPAISNYQTNLKHNSNFDAWGKCVYAPLNINTDCIRYKLLITVTIPPINGFPIPPVMTNAYAYLTKEGITFTFGETTITTPSPMTVLTFAVNVPDDFKTNTAPKFASTSVAPSTATVGQTYTYNIKVDDPDGAASQGNVQQDMNLQSALAVQIKATTKPSWLTFTDKGDGTATLTGTPQAGDVGQHNVTLEATDGAGAKATQSFTITVSAAPNQAPTFTSTATMNAEHSKLYTYNITANDADGKTGLKITATTKPNWLTFTDKGNGEATLTGTPQQSDAGQHNVVLEVADPQGAKATQSFTITVIGNRPPSAPVVTAPANGSTVVVGGTTSAVAPTTPINITWNASSDPDGDAITYQWQVAADPTFALVLLNQSTTTNSTSLTVGELNAQLVALLGKSWTEVSIYHRVVVNDGKNPVAISASAAVKLTRGRITANEGDEIPTKTALVGNYPNPFNPSTEIQFALAKQGEVSLQIYDMQGRLVQTLLQETRAAGNYRIAFNAQNLPSGSYFVRLQSGDFAQTKAMTLMK